MKTNCLVSLALAAAMVAGAGSARAADSSKTLTLSSGPQVTATNAAELALDARPSSVTVSGDDVAAGDVTVPVALYLTEGTRDTTSIMAQFTIKSVDGDASNNYVKFVGHSPGDNYFTNPIYYALADGTTGDSKSLVGFAGTLKARKTGLFFQMTGTYSGYYADSNSEYGAANAWAQVCWLTPYDNDGYTWSGVKSDSYPIYIVDVVFSKGTPAGSYTVEFIDVPHPDSPNNMTCTLETSAGKFTTKDNNLVLKNFEIVVSQPSDPGSQTPSVIDPPPVVSNVVARQRWPWNGLVDVDYEIGGTTAGLKIEIEFDEQGDPNRHWVATNFLAGAEPTLTPGRNRATWDTTAAGVTNVVTDVTATVKLVREEAATTTEGFDDTSVFEPFGLGGITADEHHGAFGDWTLYDGNGMHVYGFNGIDFPNSYESGAWQVISVVGDGAGFAEKYPAHSGDQYLISFCPAEEYNYPAADHWLISPELSGNAQAILFYARAITSQYGSETFEVWASSTNNNPESFTRVDNYATDATFWTEFSAELPAGTKHFAIRHISKDIFGLLIDDVTYSTDSSDPVVTSVVSRATFRLDTHEGPFESDGTETLTYSALWDGGEGATVTIAQDGAAIAANLSGEGELSWSVPYDGTYVLTHTTYTNGIAVKVETATFVVTGLPVDLEGEIAWKFLKATGTWFAQVNVTCPTGVAERVTDIRYAFADRIGENGKTEAALWNSLGRAAKGDTMEFDGETLRYAALDPSLLVDGRTTTFGVKDLSAAGIPVSERAVELYVRRCVAPEEVNAAAANVGSFLGYLFWTINGEQHNAPLVAGSLAQALHGLSASPRAARQGLAQGAALQSPAWINASLAVGVMLDEGSSPYCRLSSFSVDGSTMRGVVEVGASGASEVAGSIGANAKVALLGSSSPAGPFVEVAEVRTDESGAFSIAIPEGCSFFKLRLEIVEVVK